MSCCFCCCCCSWCVLEHQESDSLNWQFKFRILTLTASLAAPFCVALICSLGVLLVLILCLFPFEYAARGNGTKMHHINGLSGDFKFDKYPRDTTNEIGFEHNNQPPSHPACHCITTRKRSMHAAFNTQMYLCCTPSSHRQQPDPNRST